MDDIYLCIYTIYYDPCPSWDNVITWTGVQRTPKKSSPSDNRWEVRDHVSLTKGQLDQFSEVKNPLLLTLTRFNINPGSEKVQIYCGIDDRSFYFVIGFPRGVPHECKLVDQVTTGFENLPIISALFPVTPNKNVDRINYVHYNVLRLANRTRDAVAGLSEQLAGTSLMTVQNRMALDMLLAEKGGVCSMFGDQCCTFIPNNRAPDGSVTKALEGLRTLSEEMHEHSGINNPLGGIFDSWVGKWKGLIVSVFMSLVGMTIVFVLCGCCCIPCIRSLLNRVIITAIEGKTPPPYQMSQITAESMALARGEDYASESECDA
ncbi:uncharacterized protein LOC132815944 [Hemiscyllium ocellatum]|uniref:uncharacterized protein LOC132815944 n=1 Tax=Hemiscyllium ocellatum TaxID=170820 RepID=UPI0029673F01|nr:uncharacterized protein LOC132815944 [Hemiscyllium ocellatum]XP_060681298.1 uncharacterized protein LOC132815944 [Hemiscyllium ocellatum]XP_060681299.1 uncharacterized protein LOC132815944 [Hemiscyllium ocellatum]